MLGLPLAFLSPLSLLALLSLPIIWYLLRLTPPKPQQEIFPPLAILEKLAAREETPAKSPWWLTLLRLLMAAMVIFAMSGPIWNPREAILQKSGPVMLIVDDGWASGKDWEAMKALALNILSEATNTNRAVSLLFTTDPASMSEAPSAPEEITSILEAHTNNSVRPDHVTSADKIRALLTTTSISEAVFLSDGLGHGSGPDAIFKILSDSSIEVSLITPDLAQMAILNPVENQPGKMTGTVSRAVTSDSLALRMVGYDKDGLAIARAPILLGEGAKTADFNFEQPVELRNQIVRVEIENAQSAGAVQLLDDSNRRRIVGLISGQSSDVSQPLLSPLYYINRALAPFSDLRIPDTANLDEAANELIDQKVSAVVMADIGTLPQETQTKMTKFVEDGGLIIRFAGPRLAANPDGPLLPVELIRGDRFIGGALSWDTPKTVAAFEPNSPFFGLPLPKDVTVTRQVLAVQNASLDEHTWARLEDGTPLVTAAKQGNGWIILFHVNSDNNWSNLPLSGTFVDMLRRSVNLSRSTNASALNEAALRLPPVEVLDGRGILAPPSSDIKPLVLEAGITPKVSLETPPGFYGTTDGFSALNLISDKEEISPLDTSAASGSINQSSYSGNVSVNFKPWLLLAAAILFLLDCLAMLWFNGLLNTLRNGAKGLQAASVILAVIFAAPFGTITQVQAQTVADTSIDFSATLQTRFAYVKTGIGETDRISEAGLLGLTRFVSSRTALEPGEPVGVDISSDELSFYPFLYWPVSNNSPVPDEATMARVDAYMKEGGSILFDTQDQFNSVLNGTGNSGGNSRLREILSTLDIPPLEPVPADHVLTKSFYLLDTFPGRYQGGDLWVEQIGTAEEADTRPARAGDGVSTILITSNDFAGAWAVDDQNRSLFQTVPPSTEQRESAFRVGVNIVMYTITGNYKADQVHIPALLERLGQ